MDYQKKIRDRLSGSNGDLQRRKKLLGDLLAAFHQGGVGRAADHLARPMDAIEEEFELHFAELQKLL